LDGGGSVPVYANGSLSISVLMDQAHTITLDTTSQYSLTLDYGATASLFYVTSPTIPGDNYWYDSGTLVTFAGSVGVNSSKVVSYSLDGVTTTIVSGETGFVTSFAMTGAHSLVAVLAPLNPDCPSGGCAASFDVTVQSSNNLSGGTWVDGKYYAQPVTFSWPGGSVHNVTAQAGVKQSQVRTSFSGWAGVASSSSSTLMFTVNESGRLTAQYLKMYLVTLHFTDMAGGAIVPQSVTLAGPSGKETIGANMSAWVLSKASYTLSSVIWMDWNVVMSNDSTFSVPQPASLQFVLGVYNQTVRATDAYGLPLQGAAVDVDTLNGKTLSILTDSSGLATFRVPVGLFSATVSYMGANDQITSTSEGSHSFTVSFLLSYPLVATIAAMVAGAATFIFLKRRKRATGGPQFFSD
jgi:hypothetical protein